jgi:hypothetical protein
MARIAPRRFLQFLLNEWDVVESLYAATRKGPVRPRELRHLAAAGNSARILDRLLEYGIVIPLPNSPAYEMGDVAEGIIAQLRHDNSLGLADEVRAHLEDLQRQVQGIDESLDGTDPERLGRHVEAIQTRIKAIHRHLLNNGWAVDAIVSRAKTRTRKVPLKQRYSEVLEAWDNYIEPIRAMVDPNGPFEILFENLESGIAGAVERVAGEAGVVAEKPRLELLLLRLMYLRGFLRQHLADAADRLLPLVREVRANSVVARGASVLLGQLRGATVGIDQVAAAIPVSRRTSPGAIAGREHIEAYVAALTDYQPEPQPFFAHKPASPAAPPPVDTGAAVREIRHSGPIPDLFQWLADRYRERADTGDLLELYLLAARECDVRSAPGEGKRTYETRSHYVTARPLETVKREA